MGSPPPLKFRGIRHRGPSAALRFTRAAALLALVICPAQARPALEDVPPSEGTRDKITRTVDAYLVRHPKIAGLVVGAFRPGPDGAMEELTVFRGKTRAGGRPGAQPANPVRNRLDNQNVHRSHTGWFRPQGGARSRQIRPGLL